MRRSVSYVLFSAPSLVLSLVGCGSPDARIGISADLPADEAGVRAAVVVGPDDGVDAVLSVCRLSETKETVETSGTTTSGAAPDGAPQTRTKKVCGSEPFTLSPGDRIVVVQGAWTKTLDDPNRPTFHVYPPALGPIQLTFERGGTVVHHSEITIQPRPTLTHPAQGHTCPRSRPAFLAWHPQSKGENLFVDVYGCTGARRFQARDTARELELERLGEICDQDEFDVRVELTTVLGPVTRRSTAVFRSVP